MKIASWDPQNILKKCRQPQNVVVRDVRDADGNGIGIVAEPHDGTESGIVAAAQRATDRMFIDYADASNIQSRMIATDESGKAVWCISPNFRRMAQIGTDEALEILGL